LARRSKRNRRQLKTDALALLPTLVEQSGRIILSRRALFEKAIFLAIVT